MSDLQETLVFPQLNKPAPDFSANTTHGPKTLADYKGKWLVLFSHPADFTPVCTTEFIAFAKAYPQFQKLNTELLGLSIDSVHSHVAWVRTIKEKFGVEEIEITTVGDSFHRYTRAIIANCHLFNEKITGTSLEKMGKCLLCKVNGK